MSYASTSIPPTWRILLAIEICMEILKGLLDLAASNKAIYKLLLKYSYSPSTKALYGLKESPREWQDKLKILLKSLGYHPLISDLGVFYNAKTFPFIVTNKDDCLFIGPNIGFLTRSLGLLITLPIPAKITPAIRCIAAYKRNDAGIYTNDTSPLANKDKDNAYDRTYKPPTNIEEKGSKKDDTKEKEEDDSSDDDSTSNSASNSKDKAGYELGNSSLRYKAPTPTKPAKIMPAIRRIAARKAKRRDNAGRYTTNSSLIANKDDNNAYNRAYIPPTDIEEEEGSSSNDNSVNSSTSDSTNKGKGSSVYKRSKGALRCKDTPLYKR
ncbi:hypothetical protein P8C59_001185 [Phyllachora maydis]|uniref:Uncharacterized protein n=1 Tax=Phyllachora maydis TaxID=1825666 RepID=A0AAD9HZ31_9PEZI|nr:hypothetical protein P8C59_001185 [Phyllachora maydis]